MNELFSLEPGDKIEDALGNTQTIISIELNIKDGKEMKLTFEMTKDE